MRPLSLGLIGCGDVATTRHLPVLVQNPEVRLAVVCDSDPGRAQAAAERFGVPAHTTDAGEVLEDAALDAVIIATPPWVTPKLAVQALQQDKYVLCEKPMALSEAEALKIAEAEKASRGRIQMCFVCRHDPLLEQLKAWIDEGLLGAPLLYRFGIFDEAWNPASDPEHCRRITDTLRHGGPSVHDGAHTADFMNLLTASPVAAVRAWGLKSRPEFPAPNCDISVIDFENGDRAKAEIAWFYPVFPRDQFEALGPGGLAEYDWHGRSLKLTTAAGTTTVTDKNLWWEICFKTQLKRFVASVQNKTPCVPGVAEGLYSLRLTRAIEAAIRENEEENR